MAYRAVVRSQGLRLAKSYSIRNIEFAPNKESREVSYNHITRFCLSKYTDFDEYADDFNVNELNRRVCKKNLEGMYNGEIECSHDFYQKLFHMLLASGDIKYSEYDLLMVDEAGDLNEVTVEIFKLLPAKIKVAVGDNLQNIYGFNHTVNAFKVLDGELFSLTHSFRVHKPISEKIEKFCRKHIDPRMEFRGIEREDLSVKDTLYLSRTNSGLILQIKDLIEEDKHFELVRSANEIFRLPMTLASMKPGGKPFFTEFNYLQESYDEWHSDPHKRMMYNNGLRYLMDTHEEDVALVSAIRTVMMLGSGTIFQLYNDAKERAKKGSDIILATIHSVKGLEADRVVILEDMNTILDRIFSGKSKLTDEEAEQELNLYYVACSRAKKKLEGARHLDD